MTREPFDGIPDDQIASLFLITKGEVVVEPIPHILGDDRRPTGERGIYLQGEYDTLTALAAELKKALKKLGPPPK